MAGGNLSGRAPLPSEEMEWTVHLARRRPRQAAVVVAVIGAAAVAAGLGLRSVLLGLLAAVLLTAAVGEFLFPVHHRLGSSRVESRGLWHRRRMEWPKVRRVVRDELGVKLSPLPRPSRLEAYRGIYLWFADNADRVMATIAHHRAPEAAGADDHPPV